MIDHEEIVTALRDRAATDSPTHELMKQAADAIEDLLSRAAAPEPEWEYGLKLRGSIVRVGSQEAIRVHQSIWGGEIVRHPSGPWEPLPVGGGSDGE